MIDRSDPRLSASRIAIVTALAGLALSACQPGNPQGAASSAPPPLAAIPLATSGAPPIAPAPALDALPPAPPAQVGQLADPNDRYAFAERANAMGSAFGDAPPDYTFDNGGGQRPWVWRSDDGSTRVAEALPGGGYRYYYYEAGSRTPYLVRDPDYSYGYDNGVLVVVYDSHGRALSQDYRGRQADAAGRYLARAVALFLASQRSQREAVAEANWAAQRSQISAEQAQWAADQAADQDWRAYHDAHQQQEQQQWDAEQYRREAQAARFAQGVNDTQQAAQDWRAAQEAHSRAAPSSQPVQASSATHPGPFGFGQPPAPPQPPAPVQVSSGQPENLSGAGQHGRSRSSAPPLAGVGPIQPPAGGPSSGQNAAIQADAQRRSQELAAAHQAQIAAQAAALAQAHADAAKLAAEQQAAAAQQAEALRRSDSLNAAHQAQIAAARQAQLAAQAAAAAHAQAQAAALAAERAKLTAHTNPPTALAPPTVAKLPRTHGHGADSGAPPSSGQPGSGG